ncbi:MAG: iron chaperone [Actinomycetota bacterium]
MAKNNGKAASAPAREVDAYLATMPEEARPTLEKLRQTIKAAAPHATETISYGIAILKLQGRPLVGFGATKNHCAFYVMSPPVMEAHKDELKSYDTSKGTIRFPAGKPLPAALVKKLVKARIAENDAR